jgi:hypothetical protein
LRLEGKGLRLEGKGLRLEGKGLRIKGKGVRKFWKHRTLGRSVFLFPACETVP